MELRAESIGMHDSGGFVCGDCNEFEEVACGVGADHEESLLAVVLVLDVPEGVLPSVGDRSVIESVLPGRRGDLHSRKPYLYMHEIVKVTFTVGAGAQVLGATTGGRTTRAKCRSFVAPSSSSYHGSEQRSSSTERHRPARAGIAGRLRRHRCQSVHTTLVS